MKAFIKIPMALFIFILLWPAMAPGQDYDDGYTLFAPLNSGDTYLIGMDGRVVYTWTSAYKPGLSAYLLEDGTLMRTANLGTNATFNGSGGAGGRVEALDEDSQVIWSFEYSGNQAYLPHHDIAVLDNGHILMIAWEYKTYAEAVAAGRDPGLLPDSELWPDKIIEVAPDSSASGGTIVWEWKIWDHLVQGYDAGAPHYGVVSDHPELIDLNYTDGQGAKDWTHINSVYYLEDLDQILLSVRNFSEIWVIDHSTTTAEAAGHTGGTYGRGGDLLYRWGNPQTYGTGDDSDQILFHQHDARRIESGDPGAGNFLMFNNHAGEVNGEGYSSVVEMAPPLAADGTYTMTNDVWGPDALEWEYMANSKTDFYSNNLSGAQRLANGDTLICEGESGHFFEVSAAGNTVWEYIYGRSVVFRATRLATTYSGLPSTLSDDGGDADTTSGGAGGGGGGCFLSSLP